MYPDNEVPVSVMAKDLLTTYKYGWKTSYYQNTYDAKKDGDEEPSIENVDNLINELLESEEEDCESCKI
jgi:ribonucleoside-diphosphate reductase alpha chain